MHPGNAGCVAVFREASLEDRACLARFEGIEEEAPGSFEVMRMFVGAMLLYPTVDDYPEPAYAVAELFGYFRQYGHGPVSVDEPHEGAEVDEETGEVYSPGLPEHIARDLRNARANAKKVFTDPRYTSFYRNLILDLATKNGVLDVRTYDYLWGLTPGRLRDVVARVEQAHMALRTQAFETLSTLPAGAQADAAAHIDRTYATPMAALDEMSRGATIPEMFVDEPYDDDEEDTYQDPAESLSDLPPNGLPPNAPFSKAALIREIEGL
jgi:hypothetical protein